ncbi:MAG: DUF4178 domain-containing protein [Anaerolineae bacterium]|nr:DUF4178 domain-containing protein [Anaerolineae bacterium]
MKSMSCPSCGAPLDIKNRFVKVVTCDFCNQVMLLSDSGLDPTGRTAKLAELPSPLYVDATGQIGGRKFQVMGRLRYQYSAGLWDEWFLVFDDGQPGWLQEDEGEYILFHKETLTSAVPPFQDVAVGRVIPIARRQVFITEKGKAHIAGGEGQLAFEILPGEEVSYLDGNSGEEQVSVEYTANEIELSVGRAVPRNQLVIDEEEYW